MRVYKMCVSAVAAALPAPSDLIAASRSSARCSTLVHIQKSVFMRVFKRGVLAFGQRPGSRIDKRASAAGR
jgi:hypothetical protein